ncbi:hypothetical protein CYQ73_13900 [Enterococcus faecium]|uniref:hypothetical protein n=1 Tax=Enterococcus faecium TaxID=1352 RepID=UPI00100DEDBF|nr:hypothetical protein [Enterococcus faecium]RXU71482.1 hypothetical protein CYQ85_14205 [Enterococcus faecium]RXW60542.1 hypothetical protein CYQ73_13900 [Enterococcus faecium]
MKRIDVQINHKLVGTCEAVIRSSSPLFKDIIDPWIEIEGFVPASPSLTDDQQVVLEWLKSNRNSLKVPMLAFYELAELADENTNLAYHQLDSKQEIEVLAAFAQWGLEQEETE